MQAYQSCPQNHQLTFVKRNRWQPDRRPGQPLHLHYIYISYVEIPVVLSVDFKVGVILDFRETAGRTP